MIDDRFFDRGGTGVCPDVFENIIYNLVSNAIKYRHPDRPLKLSITSFNETKYVGLHVVGNGLGIDLERNKQNLTGLRLMTCRRIDDVRVVVRID